MVPSHTPIGATTIDPKKIQCEPQGLSIHPGTRAAQLKCSAILPIGMETMVHYKPKRGVTFAEYCSKGYIYGMTFYHYRQWTRWMKDTRAMRILATVFHKHKYMTNPVVTPEYIIIYTADKLAAKFKDRMANQLSKTASDQLEQLGSILKQGWTHNGIW